MNHVAGHRSACEATMPQTSAPATTRPARWARVGSGYSCSSEYNGTPFLVRSGAARTGGRSGSSGGCGLHAGAWRVSWRGSPFDSFCLGGRGWCCSLGGGGGCRIMGAAGPAGLGPKVGFGLGVGTVASAAGSSVFLSFWMSSARSFCRTPRSSLPSLAVLSLCTTSANCFSSAARSPLGIPGALPASSLLRLPGFTALVSSSPSSFTPNLAVSST
mmetsp:Transcript_119731/g.334195  ORF Transcript_119731/g.334195 Transcript_119731/m.334195 type:complete len:216 (-) Transcript_119731:266-913(-)